MSSFALILLCLRMCDLYEESDNYIFIKYGETADQLKKTYDDLIHTFEAHGVEKDKLDYIFSSISRKNLFLDKG